jgi:hypothetical protein
MTFSESSTTLEHVLTENLALLNSIQYTFSYRNIAISSLKACFPYEHSFAEAIQNELVSVVKWLKLVHKKQRQPFTSDSPLPPDLVIKVENL